MNKFLEFLKDFLGLSEEQVQKAEEGLKNIEKLETETKETAENQEKETEKVETVENVENKANTEPLGEKEQSAVATSNTEGVEETVNKEEYTKLQKELADVKAMLENTKAEQAKEKRENKIKSVKDCLDYSILTSLLEGVEDKDFDTKVEEIKKQQ